jgi:hypothetical protein
MGIQKPASPDGQGVNSMKGEFFDAVAGLKPSLTEFSHSLG